jgi:hypothetical protein
MGDHPPPPGLPIPPPACCPNCVGARRCLARRAVGAANAGRRPACGDDRDRRPRWWSAGPTGRRVRHRLTPQGGGCRDVSDRGSAHAVRRTALPARTSVVCRPVRRSPHVTIAPQRLTGPAGPAGQAAPDPYGAGYRPTVAGRCGTGDASAHSCRGEALPRPPRHRRGKCRSQTGNCGDDRDRPP